MKSRCVSLLAIAALLGMASFASADIVASVKLAPTGNVYSPAIGDIDPSDASQVSSLVVGGATQWSVTHATVGDVYEFNVLLSVAGLTASQDVESFGAAYHVTGGVVADDQGFFGASYGYLAKSTQIDPPSMGTGTPAQKSNAPNAGVYFQNFFNASSFGVNILTGSAGANSGGTYGDYAAAWQLGETGGAFHSTDHDVVGQVYLTANANGSFSFSGLGNGFFQVINNNANGLGTANDDSLAGGGFPNFSTLADSVNFTVTATPEPSTLALLGCSLFGLLAYAWRKRK